MRQLVLHVGRSKTGTTAWQAAVSRHRDALQRAGIRVPTFFSSDNHGELAVAFARRPGRIARGFAVESPEDQAALRKRLDDKLSRELGDGTWLFTSEHLGSRLRSRAEVDELYAFLLRHVEAIHVMACVRRPDDLAPSAYSESMKAGRTWDFDAAWVERSRAVFDHHAFRRLWRRPREKRVSFTLRPYVRVGLLDDLTATACAVAGAGPAPVLTTVPGGANEALSAPALRFLAEINPRFPDGSLTNRTRRALITTLSGVEGQPLRLTPEVAAAIDAAGLRHGGLPDLVGERDERWRDWFAAPPPVVAAFEPLDDDTRSAILARIERAGIDADGSDPGDGGAIPDSVARQARRMAVRLSRW